MATLRPVEERDSKGATLRVNPSVTFRQDKMIRIIRGRHDYSFEENPAYHEPITVQVQDGKLKFFRGTPENSNSRSAARELTVAEVEAVAPYIVKELKARPMRVREPRPMVYEVKLATVDGVPTTQMTELSGDGTEVVVTPTPPDLTVKPRGGKPRETEATA